MTDYVLQYSTTQNLYISSKVNVCYMIRSETIISYTYQIQIYSYEEDVYQVCSKERDPFFKCYRVQNL